MGSIYSAGVFVFAFASIISGFTSGNVYHKMQGDKWVWNIILAGTLFAVPTALVSILADIIARFYHSTSALPVITAIQIFLIWAIVGFPLTVLGGIAGRRLASPFVPPVRVKNAVREIPAVPLYVFIFSSLSIFFLSFLLPLSFHFYQVPRDLVVFTRFQVYLLILRYLATDKHQYNLLLEDFYHSVQSTLNYIIFMLPFGDTLRTDCMGYYF